METRLARVRAEREADDLPCSTYQTELAGIPSSVMVRVVKGR